MWNNFKYKFFITVLLFVVIFTYRCFGMDLLDMEKYKKDIEENYCIDIGLPDNYCFYNGNIVKPLPSTETATNGVFIIGAYPSAHFELINGRPVPSDNLKKPFDDSAESGNKSAKELSKKILIPLGISRKDCWITNLVKVFLFKDTHVNQFAILKSTIKSINTRGNFEMYAVKSLPWLYREIEMANPKIIITLGNEVAGILKNVKGTTKRNALLDYKIHKIKINDKEYNVVHMAHPGTLMRKNRWTAIHKKSIEELRPQIETILKN